MIKPFDALLDIVQYMWCIHAFTRAAGEIEQSFRLLEFFNDWVKWNSQAIGPVFGLSSLCSVPPTCRIAEFASGRGKPGDTDRAKPSAGDVTQPLSQVFPLLR